MICRQCGKEFETNAPTNNGFCSRYCKRKYRKNHQGEFDYLKICNFCGKNFGTNNQQDIYCSDKCRKKANPWKYPYKRICEYCGEPFMASKQSARYCSSLCAAKANGEATRKEKEAPPDRTMQLECKNCGKKFFPQKRGRMNSGFCCHKCADKWRKENAYKQNPRYTHVCQHCGATFISDNYKHKYCSEECLKAETTGRTVYVKKCPHCGNEFETINPKQVFCSSACGSRYYGLKRRGEYFCEYCGKPRWSDHPNRSHYCSSECARKAMLSKSLPIKLAREAEWKREHNKVCLYCGNFFVANTTNRIYCSDECERKAALEKCHQRYAEAYKPRTFYCAECGKRVVTTCGDRHSVYCSNECAKRGTNRNCKDSRRLRMAEAFVEPVGLKSVYKQANGVCKICGLPVPDDTSPKNIWAATRDHIVPLAKGGLHEMSNCQLAHRICNSMKCDATGDFKIDWNQKLIEEPGRWNEQLDDLYNQLGWC